jgi:hypothetical protein
MIKKQKFKTFFIRIRCFGLSEFEIHLSLSLFRISIFEFRIFVCLGVLVNIWKVRIYPFSSFFSSLINRQSAPWAMSLLGLVLIIPISCRLKA